MIYHRKTPRAQRYDYGSSGWYFITICTKDRWYYFWEIQNETMILSDLWKNCEQEILHIETSRSSVEIHEYTIMPDHIHLLMIYTNPIKTQKDGLSNRPYQWPTVWSIIKLFKWKVTKYAEKSNIVFWRQSIYHDRIIRNQDEYERIRYYIQHNPSQRSSEK
jgi:REP element-mobilizing transposase RayT